MEQGSSSFRTGILRVISILRPVVAVSKFEFFSSLNLRLCISPIGKSEPEFDAVFAENVPHGPAVNISETGSVSKRYRLAFVQRNGGGDSLVFVFFEVRSGELPECVALSAEDASFDCSLDEEFDVFRIRASDSSHRTEGSCSYYL